MISFLLVSLLAGAMAAPQRHGGFHHHRAAGSHSAPPTMNIPQLAEKLGATTLVELVTKAGLAEALSGPGPFTVFGPVNEAFTRIPPDVAHNLTEVKAILLYHVISGSVFSSQLSNNLMAQSLLPGEKIRINIYTKGERTVVTAMGAPVILADQNATNGVIHVVSHVMFPPVGTVVGFLTSKYAKDFTTLVAAVEAAGLVGTLSGDGPFTVFAPTNEAFAKIPNETLSNLLKNKTALTKVLTYHVLSSVQWSAGLMDGEKVTTVEGSTFTLHVEGGGPSHKPERVEISFGTSGQSHVVYPDIGATNGCIHAIDTVLLPPDL